MDLVFFYVTNTGSIIGGKLLLNYAPDSGDNRQSNKRKQQ